MHYLDESNILLFLVQTALLLGLARGLGELFRRFRQPTITAEILVGVALGRSLHGIDWNARDGRPAQFIFLVLTPSDAADAQLRILRDISQTMQSAENRQALLEAHNPEEIIGGIRAFLQQCPSSVPPRVADEVYPPRQEE